MGPRPPRLAERLLEVLLSPEECDEVLGDLEEEFRQRPPGLEAVLWYWVQALLVGTSVSLRQRSEGEGRLTPEEGGRVTPINEPEGRMTMMGTWLGEAFREVRFTLRGFMRRPTYALLAVATLVLGVGAVTAGYGLLHQVVLRPLPFEEADRLVAVRTLYDGDALGLTPVEYLAVVEQTETLEDVEALVLPNLDADWTWTAGEERRPLDAVRVTNGFFRALGIRPELGTLGEEMVGERRALVTRSFWVGEMGGDPTVVGRTLQINAEPYVVTGVLPASFEFPLGSEPRDVWIPFTPEVLDAYPGMPLSHYVVGRMGPGVDRERVADDVGRIVEDIRQDISDAPGESVVRSIEEDLVGSARRPLVLLTLAGVLVLLVASLNLSMLVAARNVERRDELKVRAALGASRGRILRHLLSEAGILALVGGGVAVALAYWALQWISESRTVGLERLVGVGAGPDLVLVGLVVALLPALLAAALPAFRAAQGIQELGSRGASTDRSGQRFAWILSAVESGAVFSLLVVATLVVRSLQEVTSVDPGFNTTSTVALNLFLPAEQYGALEGDAAGAFLERLEESLESLPGVRAAGTISNLPLSPDGWSGSLQVEGREDLGQGEAVVVDWELVSPGYFDAMGIPVLQGRGFDGSDRTGSDRAVVINETLARRWWPDGDALGARLSGGGPLRTVVGVVGDVKVQGLHTATRGSMYLPAMQAGAPARQELVVRVAGNDPGAVVAQVRRTLLGMEPDLAIGPVRTLDALVSRASGAFRLRAVLLGVFAILALLLGMAGIYGVTAHGVRSRRRDIGIRMAMGADGREILTDVLGQSLIPVVCGLLAGLGVVLVGAPALRSFLFGISPTDGASLVGIAALLLASAAAAVLPSAIRARRTDPVGMLRAE